MFAPRETERLEVVGLEELDDVEPLMAGYAAGWARHVEVVVDALTMTEDYGKPMMTMTA